MVASLKEIETLVDKLKPEDRAALLRFLLSRGESATGPTMNPDAIAAWAEFRDAGKRLESIDNGVSIMDEISKMRR